MQAYLRVLRQRAVIKKYTSTKYDLLYICLFPVGVPKTKIKDAFKKNLSFNVLGSDLP